MQRLTFFGTSLSDAVQKKGFYTWLSGAARPVGTVLGKEACLGLRLPRPDERALGLPSRYRSAKPALGDVPWSMNGSSPCNRTPAQATALVPYNTRLLVLLQKSKCQEPPRQTGRSNPDNRAILTSCIEPVFVA